MQTLIRYATFPAIEGGAALLMIWMATSGVSYWPFFPLVTLSAIAMVALLERV